MIRPWYLRLIGWTWFGKSMESVRRGGETLGTRKLYCLEGGGKRVFKKGPFVGSEFAEDVADHFAGSGGSDADFQARKGVGVEVLEDGFDAVVAACGAFFPEAEGAEGQGDVIIDDEDVFGRPFVKGQDLLQGAAAEVHERLRLQKECPVSGNLREVALPLRDGLEAGSGVSGQPVEHHEADIVAGAFILASWIPESDDELEHGGKLRGSGAVVQYGSVSQEEKYRRCFFEWPEGWNGRKGPEGHAGMRQSRITRCPVDEGMKVAGVPNDGGYDENSRYRRGRFRR